jgi:hypothetical protein
MVVQTAARELATPPHIVTVDLVGSRGLGSEALVKERSAGRVAVREPLLAGSRAIK